MKKYIFLILATSLFACESTGKTDASVEQDRAKPANQESLQDLSKAYFASGCFWCVEAIYESVKGVKEVISGYAGGDEANPTYRQVGNGSTGHAEAVEVYYDPEVVSFEELLTVYYASQDPTTVGQKPDFGPQYRSIVFYSNPEERELAEAAKKDAEAHTPGTVVTEILPLKHFWPAEEYHQDYEKRNPNDRYVQQVSIPRLEHFKKKHPELLKE